MTFKRFFWALILISAVSLTSLCSAAALKYGDRGDQVQEIQDYLIAQCLLTGTADGEYGSATVNAIKNFQTALGLKVTGTCDETTYKILRAAAYDEIDINTWRVGDPIPEPSDKRHSTDSTISTVKIVGEIAKRAGVGDEIIKLGVKPAKLDEEEIPVHSRVLRVEATAYSSEQPGLSQYTATGTLCRRGVIAVDPRIIPLGTKVFIPGYGYAVAEDTGGAIRGHIIDVAFDTVAECYEFGRKHIDIYIID